jgi:hypothetical protein
VYTVNDVEGKLGHGVDGRPLEPTVGGFDLIYHGAPVRADRQETYTSKLGCFDADARKRSLKKMWAAVKARNGSEREGSRETGH